ncbi:monooxygenase [Kaistia algarum]|uniref:flavin-containing monooxygenase n=1 Tax=Kaistia algarum TaxID=2083279 RepID=UPI000CE8F279|nr:NAD(P)-binding domain-containing protein [Kaistia algarum]MCX5514676.1 NAD(P)-binding domain-containing protein [Kaistia algarum]PPE78894.1 monooxygenase [Kaistia algarum]
MKQPRIAIIGAGPSGLAAIKTLVEAGCDNLFAVEAQAEVGGNWVYRDTSGHASVYETTHIISSRRLSQYSDYPMPRSYPDFPSHRQLLDYFRGYAAEFGLERFIRFNTRLEHATLEADGRWRLLLLAPEGPSEEIVDRLIVCSGHHWKPNWPDYPGTFDGEILHAHDYRRAEPFRDKRVLVVGGGNSACDIAVETSRVSAFTAISMRRGYHIVPKVVFGLPVDIAYRKIRRLPKWLRQRVLDRMLKLLVGPYSRYGLQEPSRRIMEMHPTLNSELLYLIRHGRVHPRVGIERLDGEVVRFADGGAEPFDTVIYATGYRISFPFFEPGLFDWEGALDVPLYLKMMPVGYPTLDFVGLFQPIGCIWPLAELQARVIAAQIAGRLDRPADIEQRIAAEQAAPHWNFERTPRHAIEVDTYDLGDALRRELGRAKAA